MAGNKDIPRIKNPPSGDGHHVTYRFMTATELAERDARQNAYEAMLAGTAHWTSIFTAPWWHISVR